MPEFDYVVNEDINNSEREPESKRRHNMGSHTQLNYFIENMNWEMEIHSHSIDGCHGRLWEMYNEGVRKWVPSAANREGRLGKTETCFNKRC